MGRAEGRGRAGGREGLHSDLTPLLARGRGAAALLLTPFCLCHLAVPPARCATTASTTSACASGETPPAPSAATASTLRPPPATAPCATPRQVGGHDALCGCRLVGLVSALECTWPAPSLSTDPSVPSAPPPVPSSCCLDLWICLICGHVGCGRYRGSHAAEHWQSSGHGYALELETQVGGGGGRGRPRWSAQGL